MKAKARHYQINSNPNVGYIEVAIVSKDGWTIEEECDRWFLVSECRDRRITTLAQFKAFVTAQMKEMLYNYHCYEGTVINNNPEQLPIIWKIVKSYV